MRKVKAPMKGVMIVLLAFTILQHFPEYPNPLLCNGQDCFSGLKITSKSLPFKLAMNWESCIQQDSFRNCAILAAPSTLTGNGPLTLTADCASKHSMY